MKKTFLTGFMACTILAGAGIAHAANDKKLSSYDDGSYIVLSGTAQNITDDEFDLNYGENTIRVEMDDWGWDQDLGNYIAQGDTVTVSGQVDDDWFEEREIDANNVYFKRDYSYYYVYDVYPAYTVENNNATDQNDQSEYDDGTYLSSRGTVQNISEGQMTIKTKSGTMRVDTSELSYNPFDNGGISVNDRVYVSGEIDNGFFETQELEADFVLLTKQVNKKSETAAN